jgi:hypothetical protein
MAGKDGVRLVAGNLGFTALFPASPRFPVHIGVNLGVTRVTWVSPRFRVIVTLNLGVTNPCLASPRKGTTSRPYQP